MAHDGDNPFKLQLHRVGLDGTGDTRLTDPKLNHRVDIAPDGKTFADVAQAHDVPPSTRLVDAEGNILTTLAQGDMTALQTAGFAPPELFTYKTGDGKSDAVWAAVQAIQLRCRQKVSPARGRVRRTGNAAGRDGA